MSSPSVTVIGSERIPGSSGKTLQGRQIVNTHSVEYLIDGGAFIDTPTLDPRRLDSYSTRTAIMNYEGPELPIVGITRTDDGCVCSGCTIERVEVNPRYWRAVYQFSSVANDQNPEDPENPSQDPTTWIPVWQVDYEPFEWVQQMDAAGAPATNSAGAPFEMGMQTSQTIAIFRFSQYEADTLTEKEIALRNECVNEVFFEGFEPYTLLLAVTGSQRGVFNGYPCRKIDYVVKYKVGLEGGYKTYQLTGTDVFDGWVWIDENGPSGWRELRLDVGPYYLTGSGAKAYRLSDGVKAQCNLEGDGTWAGYVPGSSERQAPPAILAFERYRKLNFYEFLKV